MSIARTILLRASRSRWLADQFRKRAFARRAVNRFMPGEDVASALAAAAQFMNVGLGTVFTALGERIATMDEAAGVRDHYRSLFDSIAEQQLPAHVSVKLTHLGLDLDVDACVKNVLELAARAEETGSFLWIDMEESNYVDATLGVFRRARAVHRKVGLCMQSYLRRTAADLESLLPLEPAIRLVKGAYREPPEVAFPAKRDTDASFAALTERMLTLAKDGKAFPILGTHDLDLIEQAERRAKELGLPPGAFEVHMLYGIKSAAQRVLAGKGITVRVLISYGTNWFPWYMRRLAERPANVWFVVKNVFG